MLARALQRAGGGRGRPVSPLGGSSLTHLYLHKSPWITDAGVKQLVTKLERLTVLKLTGFSCVTHGLAAQLLPVGIRRESSPY